MKKIHKTFHYPSLHTGISSWVKVWKVKEVDWQVNSGKCFYRLKKYIGKYNMVSKMTFLGGLLSRLGRPHCYTSSQELCTEIHFTPRYAVLNTRKQCPFSDCTKNHSPRWIWESSAQHQQTTPLCGMHVTRWLSVNVPTLGALFYIGALNSLN